MIKKMWKKHPLKKQYDIVIIGGGAHGLATAYYLSRMGVKNIAVLEAKFIQFKVELHEQKLIELDGINLRDKVIDALIKDSRDSGKVGFDWTRLRTHSIRMCAKNVQVLDKAWENMVGLARTNYLLIDHVKKELRRNIEFDERKLARLYHIPPHLVKDARFRLGRWKMRLSELPTKLAVENDDIKAKC